MPLSSFIQQFEVEWLRLLKLAKALTDSYRQMFTSFLSEDKAKRDFLHGYLVRTHKNIVDNITTKDNLSFSDVKIRLLDLDSANSTDTALATIGGDNSKLKSVPGVVKISQDAQVGIYGIRVQG